MKTDINTIKKEVITVVEEELLTVTLTKREAVLLLAAIGNMNLDQIKEALQSTYADFVLAKGVIDHGKLNSMEVYDIYTEMKTGIRKMK